MRKIALFVALSFSACESSNEYGECMGIADDPPASQECTRYRVSVWNAVLSFIFVETIIAPVLWATSYAKCPTSEKKAACKVTP